MASLLLATLALLLPAATPQAPTPADLPAYTHWRSFTVEDGLPSNKVMCVLVDGDSVWAGTDAGLARLREGRWEVFTTEDGLAHDVIVALAAGAPAGDLWIGTMGGLSRFSAGRIDSFTQLNSGLINDVIYAVGTFQDQVWVATASGVSAYHTADKRWELFNNENTVMHEPWCYGFTHSTDRVFIAVWAGGIVEYDPVRKTWKAYRDPDGEMEIDLVRDDGLVHDVTSSVDWEDGVLWASTYFGLSRYDGRTWRSWLEHESPLPSNFINLVKVRAGWAWLATDLGLAVTDGERWVVYSAPDESSGSSIRIHRGADAPEELATPRGLAHGFVFGVAPDADRVWAATAHGLSLGSLRPIEMPSEGEDR